MPNVPKGLLTEEQTRLVVEVSNSDFNHVIENSLFHIESIFTSRPSIPEHPTASDIKNLAGNLNAVIPSGFLLLHRDLEKMASPESSTKEDSSNFGASVVGLLKPMLIGAGAAVVATGIVKGLFGGVSSETSNHMQGVIDELNEGLTADKLASDDIVLKAQKIGFIAYLEAYFLQQAASLMISGTLESVGVGAGKAVVGFFNELFGRNSDSTPNKLQEITEAIIDAQKVESFIEDDAVKKAVKIGMVAYIGAYFTTQAASMITDNILSGVGGAISGAINKFFTNLFSIGNNSKSYDRVQNIIDELIQKVSVEDLRKEGEITQALTEGVSSYVKAYFTTQTAAMELDTFSDSVGGLAVNAVVGFFKSLFGKSDLSSEKLQFIVNKITEDLDVSQVSKWQEVEDAKREGISSYIVSYFDAMGKAVITSEVTDTLSKSFSDSAKSFLSSINPFNKEKKSKETQENPSFFQKATELALTLKDSDLPSEEELSSLKKSSILNIAKNILDVEVKEASSKLEKSGYASNISFQMDTNTTISSKITESNSKEMLDTLNKISDTLSVLNNLVTVLSSKDNSPTVISLPQESSEDLSVNIPG